jgi:hypothetical protein
VLSRRRLLWTIPLLILIGGLAWVGWSAWHVDRDLSSASDDASQLQAAVSRGDNRAADDALARLQVHSSGAAQRTDGPTWSVLAHLPMVGDDARGVRLVSDVLSDLSENGIEPLANTAKDLESLLPRDGKVSIHAVTSLQAPVASGARAFALADQRLEAQDSSGFIEPLRIKYQDLASRVSDAAAALDSASTALQVVPGMLGEAGTRNYLLVFQNNAEIRATGGLPGAISLVRADHGKVEMTRQLAANAIPEASTSALPLEPAERMIYGRQLGTYFLDANFTPDFPRTAALMKARWEQLYNDRIDGVLSIDPVALSYVLAATGPVTVGDVQLTSENAVDELLHEVYLRYPNPADQDAWFREVARAVFDRVVSGAESPQALIKALARSAGEHRLYVTSFDQKEQSTLSGTGVAGQLVTDPAAPPQVGVYLNDATGAKMSYYLRYNVQVDATYCTNGVQGLSAKAHLLSDAPADAASLPRYITGGGRYGTEPGSQLVLVRLYAPVGGSISDIQLNGKPVSTDGTVEQDGRDVATVVVLLKPKFTVDLTWRMTTGPDQPGDIDVSVTPGVVSKRSSSVSQSACSS